MEKLVSVVIPTYKRDKALELALNSLLTQTYTNFEIVVVDDNADKDWNEKVENVVNEFTKNNPTIKLNYIQNEVNLGSAKTRNLGIDASNGEYVTFLDDDDEYLPEKIESQVAFMIENSLDYSVTDLDLYYDNGKLSEHKTRYYIQKTDAESLFKYHLMYHITGTDTMMFSKDYLIKIGKFAPIDVGDEFYLMQRAIENGGTFGYLPVSHVKAIIHTSDDGLSSGDGKILGENQLYQYKKKYFDRLTRKEKRYVKMRHNAVLAFAEKRRGKLFRFVKYALASMFIAPIACIKLLLNRN